jgi:hypothetical protein
VLRVIVLQDCRLAGLSERFIAEVDLGRPGRRGQVDDVDTIHGAVLMEQPHDTLQALLAAGGVTIGIVVDDFESAAIGNDDGSLVRLARNLPDDSAPRM